jgi:hypothetical protein
VDKSVDADLIPVVSGVVHNGRCAVVGCVGYSGGTHVREEATVNLSDASRASASSSTRCVRSGWSNTLAAGVMLLLMIAALANTVIRSEDVANGRWRPALVILAIAAPLGLFGGMSIRAARIGVCGYADGLRVRGLLHTRAIRWESIVSTAVRQFNNGRTNLLHARLGNRHDLW